MTVELHMHTGTGGGRDGMLRSEFAVAWLSVLTVVMLAFSMYGSSEVLSYF